MPGEEAPISKARRTRTLGRWNANDAVVAGMVLFPFLGACAAAQSPVSAPSAPEANDRMFIDVIELPRPALQRVAQFGTIAGTAHRFRLDVDASSDARIIVTIEVDGRPFARATFRSVNYPSLDLASLDSYARRATDGIEFLVRIKYGEETDCFIDDDGRNRLEMHIGESAAIYRTISLANCELVSTEVPD